MSVFNRRVIVSGGLQSNERGDVLRIQMEHIEAVPDESELPITAEIAGSIDITRGKSVREHLSSPRDAS